MAAFERENVCPALHHHCCFRLPSFVARHMMNAAVTFPIGVAFHDIFSYYLFGQKNSPILNQKAYRCMYDMHNNTANRCHHDLNRQRRSRAKQPLRTFFGEIVRTLFLNIFDSILRHFQFFYFFVRFLILLLIITTETTIFHAWVVSCVARGII